MSKQTNKIVIAPQKGKQELAMNIKVDVMFFGGARGAGKSRLLLMKPLYHVYDDPNFQGVFFRRTTEDLKGAGGLWQEGTKLYTPFKPRVREKALSWKFPKGGEIRCRHMEHEKDKESHRGLQYSFIGWDELNQFSETQFTFVLASLRSEAKCDSFTVATMNPDPDSWILRWIEWYLDETGLPREDRCGKIRHFIVVGDKPVFADSPEELAEKYPDSVWVYNPNTGEKEYVRPKTFTFVNGNVWDNPALIAANPGYLAELNSLPDIEKQRQLYGNWYARAKGSSYFQRDWLKRIPTASIPLKGIKWVRGWDKAYSEPSEKYRYPDYTTSIKMGKDKDGNIYIRGDYHESSLDESTMIYGKFRKLPGQRDILMMNQARLDGKDVTIILPKDPGGGAVEYIESAKKFSAEGFIVKQDPASGTNDKLIRFLPFSSACQNGFVHICEESFHNKSTLDDFYKELEAFDGTRSTATRKDDRPDACASAYNALCKESIQEPVSFSIINAPTLKNKARV